MAFNVGNQVRTPECLPVSYGIVTQVYEHGRYYEVQKQYGRRKWRRKYTLAELEDAAALEQRLKQERRLRAKLRRKI